MPALIPEHWPIEVGARFLPKAPRPWHTAGGAEGGEEEGGEGRGGEEWVRAMRHRLRMHTQPVLKEMEGTVLREFEEEMVVAADADELMDAMGVLGEVLDGGAKSGEEWLNEAMP